MKKKILFVIPTLRMGGAEKSLVSLLKSLNPEEMDIDLLLFESGGPLQKDLPEWVNVIEAGPVTRGMILEIRYYFKDILKSGAFTAAISRLGLSLSSKMGRSRFGWKKIRKYIAPIEKEYDIAVGYLEGITDFFVIDKVRAKQKVGWIHTDLSERGLIPEEAEYYRQFDFLVTVSDICRKALVKMIPDRKDRISVIENIILPEEIRNKAESIQPDVFSDGRIHIVSVGRLEYHKGMDIAAETAKMLKQRGLSFCWHVFGNGSLFASLNEYIQENHLESYFVLEGEVSNPYPYMKAADILVQPSRNEGKSLVLDEAKILGKAIVVTDYPSVRDQIIDGKTGTISTKEPSSIADAVELLLNDQALKRELENNAYQESNLSSLSVERFYQLIV